MEVAHIPGVFEINNLIPQGKSGGKGGGSHVESKSQEKSGGKRGASHV
jgi:hypothetical protein